MIKKSFMLLIKMACMLPLLLFGLWLLQLLYLPRIGVDKLVAATRPAEGAGVFRKILAQKDPLARGHFHMTDEHIGQSEHYQPVCMTCHGTYPHGKEKKVRSLLNFHTGFMACAVCHVRKDPEDKKYSFMWVDRETGMTSNEVEGGYGKYPGKIFPMEITPEGTKRIFSPISEESAQEYLRIKDRFTPDQIAQAKTKLHEHISDKPVFCTDCHKKGGYFDFSKLGFPRNRVDNLTSTEVAGMIENYETFYLPSVIDFGGKK